MINILIGLGFLFCTVLVFKYILRLECKVRAYKYWLLGVTFGMFGISFTFGIAPGAISLIPYISLLGYGLLVFSKLYKEFLIV